MRALHPLGRVGGPGEVAAAVGYLLSEDAAFVNGAVAGQAAIVAAALRELSGVSETAILAGPYDVIARAQARDIDALAKLVTSQVQALDGVSRTMSCPVVHL
jgi:DNA-binding Lrp family transcriptional regulator